MKILKFCEKNFDLKVKSFQVLFEEDKDNLINYSKGNGQHNLKLNISAFICYFSYDRDEPLNDKDVDTLVELLDSFFEFSEINNFNKRWNCSSMLKSLLNNQSLDASIQEILKNLVNNDYFQKVGVLFLNETLMKLKGGIYFEENEDFNLNQLDFKNISIPLTNKNLLTDIIFFEQPEVMNVENLNNGKLNIFFQGEVLVSGIYSSSGPIGLIFAWNEYYTKLHYKYLDLYSQICSVAIELSKTLKQLNFAINDVKFYKESMYASDSLARIGKLSATIAHELKNPLVAIGGFSYRLKKFVNDDKGSYYLDIIISEIKRLENIVGEILNYSKTLNVNKEEIVANDIISNAWKIVAEKARVNNINLVNEIDNNLLIYVDEIRLKQVLINLFDNAIDAIGLKGTIKIEAIFSEKSVIIYIKDSGSGISENTLPKIFDPFFTTKENGTGLGLALSKKILMAHGGDLNIFNSGSGAVVAILIPKCNN